MFKSVHFVKKFHWKSLQNRIPQWNQLQSENVHEQRLSKSQGTPEAAVEYVEEALEHGTHKKASLGRKTFILKA